ncbi:hypothetical protein LDL79_02240 [Leeuwenhoekiella palythoae]|uniref:hypothetical protein n=1 Tax=Leeuwenhoekiella palythoae TaxID=573501 RepID=UPI001CE1D726|nr:hypothetical protein [Leeuwenhoekiella palythoae]UBZ10947.1 hypothetical protein LDL79_02240 [Leeuwenhoekiella palythoae]
MSFKSWIRNLVGFETIKQIAQELVESKQQLQEQYDTLKAELTSIKNLPSSKEIRYIPAAIKQDQESLEEIEELEMAQNFSLTNKKSNADISFSLLSTELVASDWLEVSLTGDQKASWGNLLSVGTGVGSLAGASSLSSKGLFTTKANVEDLIRYNKDSSFSSMVKGVDGKMEQHIGFEKATGSAFTPLIVFQLASMVTGQYYFNAITSQLNSIMDKLDNLVRMHHIERESKMKYAHKALQKYAQRRYFVVEDFVHLEHIAYDLETMREEYVTSSIEKMVEIDALLQGATSSEKDEELVVDAQATRVEKTKLKLASLGNSIGKHKVMQAVKRGVDSAGNFLGSSQKRVNKITERINELGLLYDLRSAITAEELYRITQLIELKMSMSVTNMDADRIGRIEELKQDINGFSKDDLNHETLRNFVEEFKVNLDSRIYELKEESYLAKSEIEVLITKSTESFDTFFDTCKTSCASLEMMHKEVLTGFEKANEILIDNTGEAPRLFIKNNQN